MICQQETDQPVNGLVSSGQKQKGKEEQTAPGCSLFVDGSLRRNIRELTQASNWKVRSTGQVHRTVPKSLLEKVTTQNEWVVYYLYL